MRWRAVVLAVMMLGLAGESIALAAPQSSAPQSTNVGDRRGRVGPRANDRVNDRATPRRTKHWTSPVARARTEGTRTANTASDAITYDREYRPR